MSNETPDISSGKYEEFSIERKTLVYDFDLLTLAQMKMAEAVYEFAADLEKNPPRTVEEKLRLTADRDARVLALILVEKKGDVVAPFDPQAQPLPLMLAVSKMSAKDVKRAEECIADFFGKRGRTTLLLMVRSSYELKYAEVVVEGLVRRVQAIQDSQGKLNSQDSKPNEQES